MVTGNFDADSQFTNYIVSDITKLTKKLKIHILFQAFYSNNKNL